MTLRIKIPQQKPPTGTTPMAPKAEAPGVEILEVIHEKVLCRAGCGMTCDPQDLVAGFCSRFCMKDLLGFEYD